jgi:hypothetical protein
MVFEERIDLAQRRACDVSVVPGVADADVRVDIELAQLEREQLVLVVGVAMTNECRAANAARSSTINCLVRPTRSVPTTAARSTAPRAIPPAITRCSGANANQRNTASSNSARYAVSARSR